MAGIFNNAVFNNSVFNTGTSDAVAPSGGYFGGGESAGRRRDAKEISEARQRVGITDELAKRAIAEVAQRQAERLELDSQKQFDELHRELTVQNIEWEAHYLEALASEREALISLEIARRLRERIALRDEEELWLLVQIAAQVA